jgi:two-component system, sensor histidine kinase
MDDKLKILIVDDDEITRFYISYIYKKTAQVDTAEDAETGIIKASQILYNVVILDIGLRGELSGIDVLKVIRKLPDYDKIPIIAFTAFALAGDKEKFISEGFDDYIAKPLTKEEMYAIVDKNLQKYSELNK